MARSRTGLLLLTLLIAATGPVAWAQGGSVIEARGEATYRIPIVVPPGPGGHQPDLALVYNSGEGKGPAGWLGFGWSVAGESRIERETRTRIRWAPPHEPSAQDRAASEALLEALRTRTRATDEAARVHAERRRRRLQLLELEPEAPNAPVE